MRWSLTYDGTNPPRKWFTHGRKGKARWMRFGCLLVSMGAVK
jgi:hypothetical protein